MIGHRTWGLCPTPVTPVSSAWAEPAPSDPKRTSVKNPTEGGNVFKNSFVYFYFLVFKDSIYLFLERGGKREKERRETSMCGCLLCTPTGDLAPQHRHVP